MVLCLDTVFLIDLLAGEPSAESVVDSEAEPKVISAVSFYELLFGAPGQRRRERVEELARRYAVLPVDFEVCSLAAAIQSRLEEAGELVPVLDALIAATAILAGATLVTRDSHFLRIPTDFGLPVRPY